MKKASLLTLLLVSALALPAGAGTKGTWTGYITDANCATKGADPAHKDCAKRCYENGTKLVLFDDAAKKIYKLDKQEVAAQHIGSQVKVTGEAEGNAITVESIAAAQ